mgnify:CR=1 FL=1
METQWLVSNTERLLIRCKPVLCPAILINGYLIGISSSLIVANPCGLPRCKTINLNFTIRLFYGFDTIHKDLISGRLVQLICSFCLCKLVDTRRQLRPQTVTNKVMNLHNLIHKPDTGKNRCIVIIIMSYIHCIWVQTRMNSSRQPISSISNFATTTFWKITSYPYI